MASIALHRALKSLNRLPQLRPASARSGHAGLRAIADHLALELAGTCCAYSISVRSRAMISSITASGTDWPARSACRACGSMDFT